MADDLLLYTGDNGRLWVEQAGDGQSLDELLTARRAQYPDAEIVSRADIPTDRTFRNAWRKGAGAEKVEHDMMECRAIYRQRIRERRTAKLQDLDGQQFAAQDRGDTAGEAEIKAKKQRLRDLPQAPEIDAAADPAALKALWPAALLGKNIDGTKVR